MCSTSVWRYSLGIVLIEFREKKKKKTSNGNELQLGQKLETSGGGLQRRASIGRARKPKREFAGWILSKWEKAGEA